jgi:hypothetical protein
VVSGVLIVKKETTHKGTIMKQ